MVSFCEFFGKIFLWNSFENLFAKFSTILFCFRIKIFCFRAVKLKSKLTTKFVTFNILYTYSRCRNIKVKLTFDLILHMTYLKWFYILISRGRKIWRICKFGGYAHLEVKPFRIIWGQKGVSEHPKTYDLIPHMYYFNWFNIRPFFQVIFEGR